jgi:pyruvate,water dikinase
MSAASWIRWFEQTRIDDRPEVGGKGASLGELVAAGIRVPPGFTLTTTAFEHHLGATRLGRELRGLIAALAADDTGALRSITGEMRARIRELPFPDELAGVVATAYATLGAGDSAAPVAIRSSANSEDSAEASFAGLQDTQLWVCGIDQVTAAIRDCWASLYNAESVSYRRRLGLPEAQVRMGVVVQRMVDARCAGVMFTRSPHSGDRSVIAIEGSWGLGSSIVSGEVTPDKFVVNKVTFDITQRTLGAKTIEHVPDLATRSVAVREVASHRRDTPCLTDSDIAALARVGRAVEQHYGAAQDIEWAIAHGRDDSCDRLYLLQSRPETVWSRRASAPIATVTANPLEHVFAVFGHRNR